MHLTGTASPTRAIIQGSLRLTPAQEAVLCREFMERFQTARREMGYLGPKQAYGGLLQRWQEYTRMYEGDFTHRAQQDELFEQFNTSDNVPQRAIRVFKAKANAKILAKDPWFTVGQKRRGVEDPRIRLVDEYYQELLEEAEARTTFCQGIEGACIRGNQIIKITRRVDEVQDRREVRVLLVSGLPLRDSAGRLVTDQDEWELAPDAPDGAVRQLIRDPRTRLAGEPGLSDPLTLPAEQTLRHGLSLECKPWQDFYCSPTARSLHEADCFDVYDLDVDDLLSRMHSGGGRLSDEAEAWLAKVRLEDGRAKSDSGLALEARAEQEEAREGRPRTQLAEGWIRLDADGDGRAEELHVVMDITHEQPVYYDYLQEASPTGAKPYANLRMIPLADRWTGFGFYQLLESQHAFIDRQRNRIDARSGLSGNIKWQVAGAVREMKFGVPLRFNDPRFYTIEPEFRGQEAFGVFSLPPMAEECWKLLENERQNAQLLSGTLTPQDQDFSHAPGADTLGGLELMAQESEILNDDSLLGLVKGIEDALTQGARVTLIPESFDLAKCVDILGEEDAAVVEEWVQGGEGRNLARRMTILMTKSRSLQQLRANREADVFLDKWDALEPEQQVRRYHLYIDILNSLEVDSPDKALGDPHARMQEAEMQQQGAQGQGGEGQGDGSEPLPEEGGDAEQGGGGDAMGELLGQLPQGMGQERGAQGLQHMLAAGASPSGPAGPASPAAPSFTA